MEYSPLGMRTVVSRYLRGTEATSALVRIESSGISRIDAQLAYEEAEEQGCLPAGTIVNYQVEDQEDCFYNRLITDGETLDG